MRELYRGRRTALADAVTSAFGDNHLTGLAAGCHAVLLLPRQVDEDLVVDAARSDGVRVRGLNHYRLTPTSAPPALLLAYGNVSEHQVVRGVQVIAEVVRRITHEREAAATVIGPLDPGDDRNEFLAGGRPLPVKDVALEQGEEALHCGVSPAEPTRPIEPII